MKILIAVDSSDVSHYATLVATEFFPDASHIVLSSAKFGPYVPGEPIGPDGFGMLPSPDALVVAEKEAERAVEEAQRMLGGTGETIVDVGDPGSAICEEAKRHGVDLIVVGRTEKNWLSRLFDPSVSDYVIKHAPCPVLVVRHETSPVGPIS